MDAGHGGQDPGAIGKNKFQEKNITLSIAKKLTKLLNHTNFFKAVMIRRGNYFLSVFKRTQIAEKYHANLLISIHANSSKNRKISGVSIWVLPKNVHNTRIQKHKLNKKTKNIHKKINTKTSKFKNFYEIEYDLAKIIIQELRKVSTLNQKKPKYAKFGILKFSQFPSILVETGFISNPIEEQHLNKKFYQNLISKSISIALKKYFLKRIKQYN
ncbi:N-acetylmuramoyl-L-alanine amidase family protein [Buchnera aphidicola]|uniref:N-acetylmuramoyl-L-alanine amidase family protein n=1 Tax=Buchnera aphidicola TaxID=9 RepID=UPI001E2BC1EF|nr:N-acetylmuramoyl-L-alanine amidase [Buchnera aphidicola]